MIAINGCFCQLPGHASPRLKSKHQGLTPRCCLLSYAGLRYATRLFPPKWSRGSAPQTLGVCVCVTLSWRINATDTTPCCVCRELMCSVPTVLGCVRAHREGGVGGPTDVPESRLFTQIRRWRKEDREVFRSKSYNGMLAGFPPCSWHLSLCWTGLPCS